MILGLVGFIGSGKGTVAKHLVNKYQYDQESFAHTLKDACAIIFGWPRHLLEGDTEESRVWREREDPWWSEKLQIPHFTPRYALQHIGTETLRKHFHSDIWSLSLEHRIRSASGNIVISDVRFPNEIDAIRNNGGYIVFIDNGERPEWFDIAKKAHKGDRHSLETMITTYSYVHESEWAWVGTQLDASIINTGTLIELRHEADRVLESIRSQQ